MAAVLFFFFFDKDILWLSHELAYEILVLARSSQSENDNLFGWVCVKFAVGKKFQNTVLI